MKRLIIAAALLLAPPAASAQTAPQIPFEGTDFLQPPPDMHFGEVAGVAVNNRDGHIFVFQRGNTHGPAYGAAAAQLLEFGKDGRLVREIGQNLYAWSSPTRCASTRRATSGPPTRARTWSSSSTPPARW